MSQVWDNAVIVAGNVKNAVVIFFLFFFFFFFFIIILFFFYFFFFFFIFSFCLIYSITACFNGTLEMQRNFVFKDKLGCTIK